MLNLKKNFPIFENNPWLVYLDSGASSQKPKLVIDWVKEYLEKYYANIHRWAYSLSEKSEDLYYISKEKTADILGCDESEVIYTYNSTYWFNILAQTLAYSGIIGKWDTVLIWIWEHHANIVPWQILSKVFGFTIKFIEIDENLEINREDFDKKYDNTVKVLSCSQVSNVSGKIYDVKKIKSLLRENTFFIVDGSQAVPHFQINFKEIDCDAYIFTGHKIMADSGIGVILMKNERIRKLNPLMGGWWTVKSVSKEWYELKNSYEKFEFGTCNLSGVVSLSKAWDYIQSIGYQKIRDHEQSLIAYTLQNFNKLKEKVFLIWHKNNNPSVGCFSFVINGMPNFNIVAEKFAEKNICIRCWAHCAYPFHNAINISGTCRMSLFLYNDYDDIDNFFEVLENIIKIW